jgi:antitoxin (DNA-binding transcriptional repressor) of toxin-antitoxin stability system
VKTIDISEASRPLSDYAKELGEEIIVLTSGEKPVAAIVSLKKVDRESLSLSTSPEFMEVIEKARGEFKSGRKLSLREMRQAVSATRRAR